MRPLTVLWLAWLLLAVCVIRGLWRQWRHGEQPSKWFDFAVGGMFGLCFAMQIVDLLGGGQ